MFYKHLLFFYYFCLFVSGEGVGAEYVCEFELKKVIVNMILGVGQRCREREREMNSTH